MATPVPKFERSSPKKITLPHFYEMLPVIAGTMTTEIRLLMGLGSYPTLVIKISDCENNLRSHIFLT